MNKKHIIETARKLLDSGKTKTSDFYFIKHVLQRADSQEILSALDKKLKSYPLLDYGIEYNGYGSVSIEESASDVYKLRFKSKGRGLTCYVPNLLFTERKKVETELVKLGFVFRRKEVPQIWSILIKDRDTVDKILNNKVFNDIGFEFDADEKKDLEESISTAKELAEDLFELSTKKAVSITEFGTKFGDKDLFPYQKVPASYYTYRNSFLLGDDMGLGKTVQIISVMTKYDLFPSIVICPAVLRETWEKEIKKWTTNVNPFILYSGIKSIEKADVYILSFDGLNAFVDGLLKLPAKLLVIDESHNIRNEGTLRYKNIKKFKDVIPSKILSSGTMIVNGTFDMITQLDIIDMLDHFGGKHNFISRYCPVISSENERFPKRVSVNEEELQLELRKSCLIRRQKAEVIPELPDKIRQVIFLRPSTQERKEYDSVRSNLKNWYIKKYKDSDIISHMTDEQARLLAKKKMQSIEGSEAFVQLNALRQLASKHKLGSFFQWLDEFILSKKKIVLFFYFREVLEAVADRYKDIACILTTETKKNIKILEEQFQNGDKQLFISSLVVGNQGLTLTAADFVGLYDCWYTPALNDQAEDRVHRIGQDSNKVTVLYFINPDTIEERIYDIVIEKRQIIQKSMNFQLLKELL